MTTRMTGTLVSHVSRRARARGKRETARSLFRNGPLRVFIPWKDYHAVYLSREGGGGGEGGLFKNTVLKSR